MSECGKREELSKLQRAFVDAYVLNPAEPVECLRLAGGRGNDNALLRKVKAYLKDEKVIAAIRSKQARVTAMEKWSEDKIEDRLCKIAGSSLADYIKWGPGGITVYESETLDAAIKANLLEMTYTAKTGQWRFKLNNPVAALEALARIHAMYNDKLKVTLEDELESLNDYELEERLRTILTEHPEIIRQINALAAGSGDTGTARTQEADQ